MNCREDGSSFFVRGKGPLERKSKKEKTDGVFREKRHWGDIGV